MIGKLATGLLVVLASVVAVQAQGGNGTISGTVREADRPQPGLTVILADGDGKVVSQTKTTDKGTFEFKDVPAGNYQVSAAKPVTGRKGAAKAAVMANKTVMVNISLLQ